MTRKALLTGVIVVACPTLWGCAVVGAGVNAVHSTVIGVAQAIHQLALSGRDDDAPMAYTKDALAEAAVLYPPALTTVVVPAHHPRLAAAVRSAGYAVTDRDGATVSGALPVHFVVHTGAAGVDVAVLEIGDQVLTRGYMNGQPATGWTFDTHNAPPVTLQRLQLVQRGVPVGAVSYASAGAARQDSTAAPASGPVSQRPQP